MRCGELEETIFRTQICTESSGEGRKLRGSLTYTLLQFVLVSKENRIHQMAFVILARTASDALSPIVC